MTASAVVDDRTVVGLAAVGRWTGSSAYKQNADGSRPLNNGFGLNALLAIHRAASASSTTGFIVELETGDPTNLSPVLERTVPVPTELTVRMR